MINFDWNSEKAQTNYLKHGVTFEEAKTVFYDDQAIQFFDEENSTVLEERFLLLGISNKLNILLICHCERHNGNTIRIISARKASKKERVYYTKGIK